MRREFRIVEGAEGESGTLKPGDPVTVEIFRGVDRVEVVGTSKGKGFQGVIRRHGFAGGRSSHGSMFHRAPGSIGSSAFPSRVLRGMRAAGHMGVDQITLKRVRVVRVDGEKNLLLLRGSVPGHRGATVLVRRTKPGDAASDK